MRKTSYPKIIALAILAICLGSVQALAYEAIEVADGGTITGDVKWTGTIPEAEALQVTKNQDTCSETVPSETMLISSDRGIQNVVVTIENIAAGKAVDLSKISMLDNAKCQFVPHVQAVSTGTKLQIKNSDPILHNTHSYLNGSRTLFNLALPMQGQKIKRKMKKPGVVSFKCDAGHTWMSAYVIVHDNPYFAVADENGSFTIADIPPGTYQLKAWHEILGEQTKDVTITPNGTTAVSFSYSP